MLIGPKKICVGLAAFFCSIVIVYGMVEFNLAFWIGLTCFFEVFRKFGRGFEIGILICMLMGVFLVLWDLSGISDFGKLNDLNVELSVQVEEIKRKDSNSVEILGKFEKLFVDGKELRKGGIGHFSVDYDFLKLKRGLKINIKGRALPVGFMVKDGYFRYLFNKKVDLEIKGARVVGVGKAEFGLWWFVVDLLESSKNSLNSIYRRVLGGDVSALISGIMTGDKIYFSQKTIEIFREIGLMHVLAISGFNIVIVIGFLESIFSGLLVRKIRFLLIVFMIFLFVIFTGQGISVVRAAIMGVISLGVKYSGRENNAVLVLFLTAFLMVIFSPRILSFDLGFQLSFLATFGLLTVLQKFNEKFGKNSNIFLENFFTTLAATIVTLPFLASNFDRFNLLSFVANVLVLPLIPFLMLMGAIIPVVELFLPVLNEIVKIPVNFLVEILLFVSGVLAAIPGFVLQFDWFLDWFWCFYVLLLFRVFDKPRLG